jgi:Flp pilus assembly protein TadG
MSPLSCLRRGRRHRRLRGDERGVAVLELVLLAPVFVLMVAVVVGMGRLGVARNHLDAAARDAARAGSLTRSADDAQVAARSAAVEALGTSRLTCAGMDVAVGTSRFRPGGWVRVELSCTVSLADVAGAWIPGTRTMTAASQAVVDTYRGIG